MTVLLIWFVIVSFHHQGFPLGATVESKTKGIWMWCVPHPRKTDHTLVLLDTEGLGDIEKVRHLLVFCSNHVSFIMINNEVSAGRDWGCDIINWGQWS